MQQPQKATNALQQSHPECARKASFTLWLFIEHQLHASPAWWASVDKRVVHYWSSCWKANPLYGYREGFAVLQPLEKIFYSDSQRDFSLICFHEVIFLGLWRAGFLFTVLLMWQDAYPTTDWLSRLTFCIYLVKVIFMLSVHLANHFHFPKMIIEENFTLLSQMPVFRLKGIFTVLFSWQKSVKCFNKNIGMDLLVLPPDSLTLPLTLNQRLIWGGRLGIRIIGVCCPISRAPSKPPYWFFSGTCAVLSFWLKLRKRKRPVLRSVALLSFITDTCVMVEPPVGMTA